ncbi:fungal-specific transcription factor domain protein [Penicillium malachiteum]|uniref:fungal-specific transcription factor domain protein n=1 Tax=Penicillium malachiteum TaxID=1324776 RepID=UPI0025494BE4|nr:fungal-specific transcription factor domain protein [Penicillium malachiteum]KAJ5735862.1 fungal-specific transcription factor domain protein [Penicillium malachiteum]
MSPPMNASLTHEKDHDQPSAHSPASSEYGSMRHHSHGANYVGSIHWSAVLDSISELKDHYEKEEEARMLANSDPAPYRSPGPLLLYQPVHTTKAEILASIPPRGHFLKQYENFWQDPASASLLWLGLLFSMMALSTQHQQLIEDTPEAEALIRISNFRERIVHCLVLGEFTKGTKYILETLIHYITLELLLCKDADIGAWLVMGIILQLALSRGYHRDPQNFPKISLFDAEMRRRVWAVIVQMDLRLSSQMGFPRLLKLHQCDTIEPLNLIDSDFDETTTEMPPSRSENDITPVLYLIARNRIDHISGQVSDLLANTQEHSYAEVMRLDGNLQEANELLPPIFQWQPLSQSLTVPPHIVMQRIWLQLSIPRMTIWLHRKYLGSAYDNGEYEYSIKACIQAAIQIVEFQKLLDDETQSDGMLYPVRWMLTSLSRFVFLLGMSILCYYVQLSKKAPEGLSDNEMTTKIYDLLHSIYPIWLRWSPGSREAQKAAEHLSLILGLGGRGDSDANLQHHGQTPGNSALVSQFGLYADSTMPCDPFTWNDYQGEQNFESIS